MKVDPQVCHAKFDAEVAQLREREDLLRHHHCCLWRVAFPFIDVVFIPRNPLNLAFPVPRAGSLIVSPFGGGRPLELRGMELPPFSARPFGVRFGLDDYDLVPPSVTFCDPASWEPLPASSLPEGQNTDDPGRPMRVVQPSHPEYKRPFFCMRGTREYHEHPQHSGDSWLLYRGDLRVLTLISNIARTCVDSVWPSLLISPQPGGLQTRVLWPSEAPNKL